MTKLEEQIKKRIEEYNKELKNSEGNEIFMIETRAKIEELSNLLNYF